MPTPPAAVGGLPAGRRPSMYSLVAGPGLFPPRPAPPPADSAAALAALRVVRSPSGASLRATLRRHVERIAPGHPSPIIPVVVGDERRALAASAALLERGLLVPAIRPPTVAPGTSRLRVALSAAHTDAQVALRAGALREPVGAAP